MKLSIITVSYNSEETIQKTIDSVHGQSYEDVEYIIIDGNSRDSTEKIIKENNKKVSKYISEEDSGIYDAMNKGIKLSSGEIIGTLNSDDTFYDNRVLEKVAKVFSENDDVDCLYGNLIFVGKNNKIIRRWKSRPFTAGLFQKSWSPAHPTFYCRREVFDKFGLYKSDYKIAGDVEFMLRVMEVGKINSYYLDEILVKMSVGGVSTEGLKSTITISREMRKAFIENNLKFKSFKYIFYKFLKIREYLD